jgi:tRNA dimethylallyltransferase
VPEDSQARQGIGYKEMIPCVRGLCTAEEAGETIAQNTRHYAKRQMTWFRGEKDIVWLEADAPDTPARLEASLLGGEA